MKETTFIQQNREKWERFEKVRKDGKSDPDELSNLFVEITDDLSYARSFYPRRSVRVYLNNLAQSVFNSLYKLKKDPFGNFFKFWKISLPVEMYRARKHLYVSFLVFGIAILIGVVSTFDDVNFARVILGDEYVDMTDTFIEEGDPMAVYKQQSEFPMFVRLFLNNIRVAFLTFAAGLLFCVGTGLVLFTNGIMIGTFHSYFYLKELAIGKSLFITSILTVWIHGTFEILAIVLSGAAGFVAGMSVLNPGNYTRMQSFQIGLKRGLKIMLGVTPFIFFAAILEGFVTRHTEMPVVLNVLIILISFIIFVFYFMIYPFRVVRKYKDQIAAPSEPMYHPSRKVQLYKIKQVSEMVADTFVIFRSVYSHYSKWLWGVIIPIHLVLAYFMFLSNAKNMNFHNLRFYEHFHTMLTGNSNAGYFILAGLVFSLSLALPVIALRKYEQPDLKLPLKSSAKNFLIQCIITFPFMLFLLSVIFIQRDFTFLLFLVIAPAMVYLPSGVGLSDKKGFEKVRVSFQSYFAQIGNNYGLFLLVALIVGGIFMLLNSTVYGFVEEIIEWHTITQMKNYSLFINFIHTAVYIIFFHHLFIFLGLAFGLAYYVGIETSESVSLFRKLKTFGSTSKTHEKKNTE